MLAEGLEGPGHQVALYVALLGQGFGRARHQASDPYKAESIRFRLPAWEEFDFVVYGSVDGIAGAPRFERRVDDATRIGSPDDLEPWRVVENDLTNANWNCEVGDEWYPIRDLVCTREDGSRMALCFDFGLLQRVAAMGVEEVERN